MHTNWNGVVSETVGVLGESSYTSGQKPPIQLQRIVSRCKCEFFYVSYGDTSIDPGTISEVPPPPVEESMSPWENQDEPVDAFTLMHHDLDVCTNSLQYAMILVLEMSDDPFEVKLRDNYVLLLDEYHESVKRKELFDQKIAQLCSERLMLPPGTLEELNANLIKKNSEIYIQRSKKISESGPPRTRLIAWIMTDLEIMAMADPSLHGGENAVRWLRMLDPESPWPDEGIEFVTLWVRAVNIGCSEWKFMLRDYPQPMFHVKAMHLFGTLAGAEMAPPRRAKRDVEIELGEPFGTHTVQRSMTSIKFYHDFLQQFSVDAKLEGSLVNIYSKLSSFVLIYNHREIYGWISKNFFTGERAGSRKQLNPATLKLPGLVAAQCRTRRTRNAAGGSKLLEDFTKTQLLASVESLRS